MEERRFDDMTRVLARSGSRRAIAGALLAAAGALLGRPATAQSGWIPLGGACVSTGQCAQSGDLDYVYCGDNGFGYDGEFNCCRYAGLCQADEHCCGASFCYQGQCTTTVESDSYYRGAGEPCTSDDQCQAASGALYCDDNGFSFDGHPFHCCAYDGDRCASSEGCCGYLGCSNGICTAFPEGGGGLLSLGEPCSVALECSGGGYFADCTYNGIASGPVCCLINGQGCGFDSDCCGTDICVFDSFEGGGRCAQYFGGACLSDAGCAAGLICSGGYCQ